MKTPSFLAIVLSVAALPAGAAPAPKPGARCDSEWLEKTQAIMSQSGRSVADERIEVVGDFVKLKFGHLGTCDAATWRHLATLEPVGEPVLDQKTGQPVGGTALRWRNRAAGDFWKDTAVAQHIGLVLVVDDFYRVIDGRAAAIVAAADEVIDAAKAMGFADYKVSEKPLAELSKGTSGGPIGAMKPRVVTVFEEGKQVPASIAREQLGATMRKLVNDGPVLGDAVLRFRTAVLALEADLGGLGKADAFLKKRVAGATPGLNDFTSGLPKEFVLVKADKANALADEKYASALAALVGPGSKPELGDQGLRGAALLDPIDLALRNLIAIRSAEVDKIFASAKRHLKGKTVTGLEVAARAEEDAKGAKPLAGAALKALAQTPEYMKLDELYDASRKGKGEDDADTKAIGQAREEMKKAALSATLEADKDGRESVVFTQNGRKIVLGSIVPPQEGPKGDAARENAADIVARFIVDGVTASGALATLAKVVGDPTLDPGQTMDSGVKGPGELAASKEVPKAIAKINADGAGCKDPRDIYRNNYESYAARKQAAAAEMASGNARTRSGIDALETKQKEELALACQAKKDAAAAIEADSFTGKEALAKTRADAALAADAWCKTEAVEISSRAKAAHEKLAAQTAKDGSRDPSKGLAKANAELEAAFAVAVTGSVSTLRKDYTNPAGGPRLTKLLFDAELNALSLPRLVAFNKLWFMERWPEGDELNGDDTKADERKAALAASLAKCQADLGFSPIKDKKSKTTYGNPENPDTVSRKCGIQKDLTDWIKKKKGTVTD